jgi:TolB-like protein/Tfp pilus assembly protein PilF
VSEQVPRRRLAAILAADVVGYSRLMQSDEAGTLAALKARRTGVLQPLVGKYHGRIVKVMGDGVLIEFASAVDAVACSVVLQEGMEAANAGLPEDRRIVLRIGINLGDVMIEGSDLYGDGVNIAARLEGIAEPGGILISGSAYDQVKNKIDQAFEDLGPQSLKNIADPLRVYRVRQSRSSIIPPELRPPDKPSIAVLPFTNMSGDPEQQYFSDGITEDILTELQRFRNLLVIARNSSFQYRDGTTDINRIRRELGARYLLEGSIRRVAERVRITAQLIDAETGAHLWANRYDRSITDLFAVQDEISKSIVMTVWSAVDEVEGKRARVTVATQLAAYDYILRARKVWFNFTREANTEARVLITKALEIESQYAVAWAWLAWVHIGDWRSSWSSNVEQSFALATQAAKKAISLDPHDYFTHWPMAYLLVRSRRFDEGVAEYEKTLALNPNDSWLLDEMSSALCLVGRPEEAIAQLEIAIRLDPLHPDAFFGTLGFAYYMLREYDKAVAAMRNMVNTPGGVYLDIRAAAYAQLGRQLEARTAMAEYMKMQPGSRIGKEKGYLFKNPADREHLLDGLRKAGMPE